MFTAKMKKTILFMLLAILPVATALESTKVFIVDLTYSDGNLVINDHIVKYGYAPDRKLQPLEGYKAEIVSAGNEVLYSFRFNIPLKEYLDVGDNVTKQISGGLIRLTETDFALILPYYDDAKEIVFYDEQNDEVASVGIEEEKLEVKEEKEGGIWIWSLEFFVLLVLIVLFVRHKMKEKKEEE